MMGQMLYICGLRTKWGLRKGVFIITLRTNLTKKTKGKIVGENMKIQEVLQGWAER